MATECVAPMELLIPIQFLLFEAVIQSVISRDDGMGVTNGGTSPINVAELFREGSAKCKEPIAELGTIALGTLTRMRALRYAPKYQFGSINISFGASGGMGSLTPG